MLLIKTKAVIKQERFAVHCAMAGLIHFLLTERRSLLYTIATVVVVALGYLTGLSKEEWILLSGSIAAVWVAEMFNTCIEEILNLLHPQQHIKVKRIKDMAAGAVLFTALCSAVTGLLIFLPKLL